MTERALDRMTGHQPGRSRAARHRAARSEDGERYAGAPPNRGSGPYQGSGPYRDSGPYRQPELGPRQERSWDAPRYRRGSAPRGAGTTGGADGNERLTAITGAVLLVLLAAEGVTILSLNRLMTLHFFVGMLLIGPVMLKAGSTVYRFGRYYAGAADYRRKGPPALLLRLLGPLVLTLSLAVIGTGVMLAINGPGQQFWMFAHKASFVLWFAAMTIHVLAYVWRLPRLVGGDMPARAGARAREVLAGRSARWLLVAASILSGLLLALLTYHLAAAWTGFHGGG